VSDGEKMVWASVYAWCMATGAKPTDAAWTAGTAVQELRGIAMNGEDRWWGEKPGPDRRSDMVHMMRGTPA
jgi:hypothetical protein